MQAEEAETVLEVAKGEGVQNSDIPAAAVLSSRKDLPAKPGAPGTSNAMKDKLAASPAAPASQGAPVKVRQHLFKSFCFLHQVHSMHNGHYSEVAHMWVSQRCVGASHLPQVRHRFHK